MKICCRSVYKSCVFHKYLQGRFLIRIGDSSKIFLFYFKGPSTEGYMTFLKYFWELLWPKFLVVLKLFSRTSWPYTICRYFLKYFLQDLFKSKYWIFHKMFCMDIRVRIADFLKNFLAFKNIFNDIFGQESSIF